MNRQIKGAYEPTDQDLEKLKNSYTYHPPKEDQIPRYGVIRQEAEKLALLLLMACPPSRERSVALTNLEQVVMWANKSIACNE